MVYLLPNAGRKGNQDWPGLMYTAKRFRNSSTKLCGSRKLNVS
jgi:hypothetical protein